MIQDSILNIGLVKPVSENFFIKLAYVKGNTLNFGFSYKVHAGKQKNARKKYDPYIPVKNSESFKKVNCKIEIFH